MHETMFEIRKLMLLSIIASSILEMCKTYELQHVSDRLDRMEINLKNISESLQDVKEGMENDIALNAKTRSRVSELDVIINSLNSQSKRTSGKVSAILTGIELLYNTVKTFQQNETDEEDGSYPSSCQEAFSKGQMHSGIYEVQPENGGNPIKVFCDQVTDGGGWTVFQRRQDGSIDFYRTWQEYKDGFGDLEGEFWLGNDNIHRLLLDKGSHVLRLDLEDFEQSTRYAKYSTFMVGSEKEKYVLTAMGYTGNAGDSFVIHNGRQFSTKDNDNDKYHGGSCSQLYEGAWWYNSCHYSNLNGLYNSTSYGKGINWRQWKGYYYSLKSVEMKFR